MNNNFVHLMLLYICVIFLTNYKKKSESSPTAQIDLSTYSGVWKGSIKMVKTGSCNVSGTPNYTTTQNWTVDKNGNVSILESITNGTVTVSETSWLGKIDNNSKITINSTQPTSCFGTSGTITIHLNGNIVSTSTGTNLHAVVKYPVCPPSCLFNLVYSVKKQ